MAKQVVVRTPDIGGSLKQANEGEQERDYKRQRDKSGEEGAPSTKAPRKKKCRMSEVEKLQSTTSEQRGRRAAKENRNEAVKEVQQKGHKESKKAQKEKGATAKALRGKVDDGPKKGLGGSGPSVEVRTLSWCPLNCAICL